MILRKGNYFSERGNIERDKKHNKILFIWELWHPRLE